MKEIKVIVSPHYFEEELVDEVTGLVFKKGKGAEVYSIALEEHKLSGIQNLLRKNFLIPYNKETLEFVRGNDIAKAGVKKEEKKEEVKEAPAKKEEAPKKEEPKKEAVEAKEVEKKEEPQAKKPRTTRKRTTKKASE